MVQLNQLNMEFFAGSILRIGPARQNQRRRESFMAVTAKIEGNKLIITADLETPTPSASGKTLVVASTRGNKATDVMIDGKPVIIGLNAYIKK
jgi:hypothetical protein